MSNPRPVIGPHPAVDLPVRWPNITAAAEAWGTTPASIWRRVQRKDSGWRYADELTAAEKLNNLMDAMAEDILAMPDTEIEQEMREDGIDPKAAADETRAIFEKVLAQHRGPA